MGPSLSIKKISIFHSGKHHALEEGLMNQQKLTTEEKKIPPLFLKCQFPSVVAIFVQVIT